jgi:hypothetical protein
MLAGLPTRRLIRPPPETVDAIPDPGPPPALPGPVVARRQSNLVLGSPDDSAGPFLVVNYQILNPPPRIGRFSCRKRRESPDPKPPRDKPPRERGLRPRRRFWHVLGIDIIISADMEPMVLELNDRPSLSVTVPFEKDLKVKLLRDCFFHVDANGDTHGDCEDSDWQQIFPLRDGAPCGGAWGELLAKASAPLPAGNVLSSSCATDRMVFSGVKPSWHNESRQRFFEMKEAGKGSRFNPF